MTQTIKPYVLIGAHGDEIHIINYGARITKWLTTVNGKQRNIILGFDEYQDYLEDESYLGAIAGPYANRIKNASVKNFYNESKPLKLAANEGQNQLHGGPNGFANIYWELIEHQTNCLKLACELQDGFNGYPGPIYCELTYQLVEHLPQNTQQINKISLTTNIKISTKKATIAGPTTHPYFNLSGRITTVEDHSLQVNTDSYTEIDRSNIPTGVVIDTSANDVMNFAQKKKLSRNGDPQKLDDNFIIRSKFNKEASEHATLFSPTEDLKLVVKSNYPCIQVYTGEHLSHPFVAHQGICLEPQFAPNSPNTKNFVFEKTTKDKPLKVSIEYRLIKGKNL